MVGPGGAARAPPAGAAGRACAARLASFGAVPDRLLLGSGPSPVPQRVLDALQLSAAHSVSTPVNWNVGDDVIISPAMSDDEAADRFPKGFKRLKPYLRLTAQPGT